MRVGPIHMKFQGIRRNRSGCQSLIGLFSVYTRLSTSNRLLLKVIHIPHLLPHDNAEDVRRSKAQKPLECPPHLHPMLPLARQYVPPIHPCPKSVICPVGHDYGVSSLGQMDADSINASSKATSGGAEAETTTTTTTTGWK